MVDDAGGRYVSRINRPRCILHMRVQCIYIYIRVYIYGYILYMFMYRYMYYPDLAKGPVERDFVKSTFGTLTQRHDIYVFL